MFQLCVSQVDPLVQGEGSSCTVTGLVRTSLVYSATVIGPVAFILEVRCLSMEGPVFSMSGEEQQKSLV